jgi:NAD(P)-dependent dehydrogenase (short-subunit alcohol dehydrogenase family)
MAHLVTGATGFIGRSLVPLLLARSDEPVFVVVRDSEGSRERLAALLERCGPGRDRVQVVEGDLDLPSMGVADDALAGLRGKVDHMFHLAALYDMRADEDDMIRANVEGAEHAVELAEALEVGCLHHVSSIAAAGRYRGSFREDMFDEAEGLDDPYFRTKHDSERVVRETCSRPWRVYRPGIVVGDSSTGEIDKIDGPYYFFKLIQKLRGAFPPWFPLLGIEGGEINLVPVDFVARALDHIAHAEGLDGRAFHLTDPSPSTIGNVLNTFARAAHAPEFGLRVEVQARNVIPRPVRQAVAGLAPVRRITDGVLDELGIPRRVLSFADYPTRFDCRDATAALAGSGIEVPRLENYAWRLWDYWERHLDPDLFRDRSLAGAVSGRRVLITGASAGIGRATALAMAAAGAEVVLVARSADKLEELAREIAEAGGTAHCHTADLSELADCDRLVGEVLATHGGIDILINNAGRSIRRSLALSYDRFHDFERTMRLNYFGAVKLILGFLPGMHERRFGHIVNVSSIGVQANPPRFSAYVASKAALDAFSRCAASELVEDNIAITTVYMPLVKTEMIAPTSIYRSFPTIGVEEASEMICRAAIDRPKRVSTRLGIFGQIAYAVAPKAVDVVLNVAYKMFPDSAAARGEKAKRSSEKLSDEAVAFAHLMRGVHW